MNADNPWLRVFLSNAKKEVFHSIEHRHQIWRENPFDVEQVHEHARAQFQRLLAQATTPPGLDSGRILLLLGESGSGKTHLVRSFRNYVHCNGLGFVGYMQMTTTLSYGRYLVSNLIDSLDQPYYESVGTTSGLLRLSNALAARCGDPQSMDALADNAELSDEAVADLVERAAERFVTQPRYSDLDFDLVRALLFLQRQTPRLKQRVVRYLRCEDLADRDQRLLGGIKPRLGDEDGQRLVEQLGRLIGAFNSQSLVLCVDQFEDAYQNEDTAAALFRRAVTALCSIADRVPSSIIVVSCLEDYYDKLRSGLTLSMIDRIEGDPTPARLKGGRSATEVEMIIRQRLGYLYETSGEQPPEGDADAIYPVPRELVERVTGLRVRSVLDEVRQFRDACAEAGELVALPPLPSSQAPSPPPDDGERRSKALKDRLEQDWNDYLAQARQEPPESDERLAELVAWAIRTCADELESRHRFEVSVDGRFIEVGVLVPEANGKHRRREEILVAICNLAPQGNGLRLQIEAAQKRAQHRVLALVRCGEFPRNPRTQIAKVIADVISKGGRKAVIEDSDLRKIAAFQSFRAANERRDHFMPWLMEENHLSRLLPLMHTLDLDGLDRFDQGAPTRPASVAPPAHELRPSTFDVPPTPAPASISPVREGPRAAGAAPLSLGSTGELIAQELTLDPEALTAHAAFLGSTGSGKTTLALHVIEQLLLRGVPAVLIDRKGDLCAYAREAIWSQGQEEPAREARRRALRERLDVALFTPGHREGRQLALSLMPRGLSALTDLDREQAAGYSAQALGDMLGYKHTRKDKALRAILVQAFQLFAAHGNADRLTLDALIEFIANEDPALVTALGRLDNKHFKVLVDELSALKISASDLLSGAETLDPDMLFGLGAHARKDRTRLSIISTRFLGDNARSLFWVSQLLLSLTRWISRAPSPNLTAVVLFDEADLYLPAQSQPATKAPMENLLRRARSGGLGLFLATQSPGDLDYKCRDNIRSWFVGRVTQAVALEKMKPLLSDARVNVGARIPGQKTGEFHLLQDGRATPFRADRSILQTEQVPEHEILNLAAWHRRAPGR